MTETLSIEENIIIDKDIRNAILNSDEKYILVEASAGSGKTYTLVEKAFWYTHHNYLKHYQKIALITFTQYATSQIKDTVKRLTAREAIHKEYIREKYQRNITVMTNFSFVSKDVIRPFLRDAYGKGYPTADEWHQEFTNHYKFSTFNEGLATLNSEKILGSYKDNKKNFNFELAIQILKKSSNAREYLKIKYPIIMIDEYQDVDSTMHKFFMYLKNKLNIRLFIVGDIKQAIYGFRGADPYIFIELRQKNFNSYELIHNFRSHQSIVHYSREFVPEEDKYNHLYNYKESRVKMLKWNISSFIKYIIEYTNDVNETYAYLLGNKYQVTSNQVKKLESHGYIYMEDTPLNSRYANYDSLKWLLKSYHDERVNLFEIIHALKADFLTDTIEIFKRVIKKLRENQIKETLVLFEQIMAIEITKEERGKFKKSLDKEWSKYFQSEEPKRQILTIHGSKGLEFDHVFIDANSFYYYRNFQDKNHYVAITRAKESLTINLNNDYKSGLIIDGLGHWLQK